MSKEEIIDKIKSHRRFKELGFVQQARVPIIASWILRVISGLRAGIDKDKVLNIVRKHRVNNEFNGIPTDIIIQWINEFKSQLKIF